MPAGLFAIKHEITVSNIVSSIQFLNSFPPLVNPFLTAYFFPKMKDCWNNSEISFALQDLLKMMNSGFVKTIDMKDFISIITKKLGEISEKTHPHEITTSILENLSNEYNKDENWINDLARITFEFNFKCDSCSHFETRQKSEFILNIKSMDSPIFNLDDYLKNLASCQVENIQKCTKGSCTYEYTIKNLPEIILIKTSQRPKQSIDYSTKKVQISNTIYNLIAISITKINHFETISKNSTDQNWYLFKDDSIISLKSEQISSDQIQPFFFWISKG